MFEGCGYVSDNMLDILGKNSLIRPSYNGRNYVVVGGAVVIPFNSFGGKSILCV